MNPAKAKTTKSDDQVKADSFLNEFQLEGKGHGDGKIALENWEDAMDGVNKIVTPETAEAFSKIDWDTVPRHRMAIYCHDCRAIVPAELKTFGKRTREVCGQCRSKKISKGREDALKVYYHLVGRDGEEIKQPERPKRDFSKAHDRGPRGGRDRRRDSRGSSRSGSRSGGPRSGSRPNSARPSANGGSKPGPSSPKN